MTLDHAMTALFGAGIGFAVAGLLTQLRLNAPPRSLMRMNLRGHEVPAVLGGPLCMGALSGLLCIAILDAMGWHAARTGRAALAIALCTVVMFLAGSWDDRRGDERPRGFTGHLAAARGSRLTGGLVKLTAGALAGLASAWLLAARSDGLQVRAAIEVALLVPLAANLINLFDRAPGRAAKVAFLIAAPVAAFGHIAWTVAAAPLIGALGAITSPDLRERAMLGDAGANPLGAVLGVGLALALPGNLRTAAVVVLLALNLASERWSFSAIIERTPGLRALDRWGRTDPDGSEAAAPK